MTDSPNVYKCAKNIRKIKKVPCYQILSYLRAIKPNE